MTIDYTQPEIKCLIDLIRQDNGNKSLTAAQVTFGTPSVYTPIPGVTRNTIIVGQATAISGMEGNQSFYYNRIPLIDFINPLSMSTLFEIDGETKLSDLLPAINARFNINLSASKIYDLSLPSFAGNDTPSVQLKVTPDSMVYLGQITLTIKATNPDLADYLPVTELQGLTYEPPAQI